MVSAVLAPRSIQMFSWLLAVVVFYVGCVPTLSAGTWHNTDDETDFADVSLSSNFWNFSSRQL